MHQASLRVARDLLGMGEKVADESPELLRLYGDAASSRSQNSAQVTLG